MTLQYINFPHLSLCLCSLARFVASWIDTREVQSEKANLMILFDKYCPPCLEASRGKFKKITPISGKMLERRALNFKFKDRVKLQNQKSWGRTRHTRANLWAEENRKGQIGWISLALELYASNWAGRIHGSWMDFQEWSLGQMLMKFVKKRAKKRGISDRKKWSVRMLKEALRDRKTMLVRDWDRKKRAQ